MSFPYKGVLFDWAWTLVDLGPEDDHAAFRRLAAFLEGGGFSIGNVDVAHRDFWELFREQIRVSRECCLEAHFESMLNYLAQERNWVWTDEFRHEALTVYYEEMYQQRRVYPDVIPTLEVLKQLETRLGIISNTTNPGFMKDYERKQCGLDAYFDFCIYSSQVPFRKPHPSIFKLAAKRMGLAAPDILFVGDHYQADIVGAHRVGMATAWLNRKRIPQPEGPRPDFEISEIEDVLSLRPSTIDHS